MQEREFKYYPEDFGDLKVEVKKMNLIFDVFEDHTVVDSEIHFKTKEQINFLELNAKNLEILEVKFEGKETKYEYKQEEDILQIKFPSNLKAGENYSVFTRTICKPTSNILEGLYYDETPKGCPCQQITQCQQWGFQRIVPCIDDMTAKCFYHTTIIADKRYTNILSNGDLEGEIEEVDDGRVKVKYANELTPMATYLFFLGVGTYKTFKREFEYPNGDKFDLELLVPPDSDTKVANRALSVLHDSIMWIYLFTGPNKYENEEKSLLIKELVDERERLKLEGYNEEELESIRNKIAKESEGLTFGYKYTGTVYREIGMQNSDFGGMENVGNTTISTNRIMPFPEMTDGAFEYMVSVKVHEFYHNLNGSEVTGRSPFEIWLNEAVTVFIEQSYHGFLFGESYSRLSDVLQFIAPGSGTFAGDDNAAAMPIEPDGFNDPNELITGVTYAKAPEFVRMIERLMGKETFVKGLDLYHRKYKHSNASRAQWVECMEEASGLNFTRMAKVWLKQSSYPKLKVEHKYDKNERKCTLHVEQSGFKEEGWHWEFPLEVALVDEDGNKIYEEIFRVNKVKEIFEINNVSEPAFVSWNRDFSCFAKVENEASNEILHLQARKDKDLINRYLAFNKLADQQMLKLVKDPNKSVDENFLELYFELLSDQKLSAEMGSLMLTIFETVSDPQYKHSYWALFNARKKIKKELADKYKKQLFELYDKYSALEFEGTYVERKAAEIKARQIKNTILSILAKLDNEKVWNIIKKQFENSQNASDKNTAFALYLDSSASDKKDLIKDFEKLAKSSLVRWESFLGLIAGVNSTDIVELIKEVEKLDNFRVEQANDQRALYVRFAFNRKQSLLTEKGREFLLEKIIELTPINEYSTGFLLKVLGNIPEMLPEQQDSLLKILKEAKKATDKKLYPSVFNTVERILKASQV